MSDINQIRGLHHITSLSGSASENNAFFTRTLGLRRVKKTVNFDAPDVYHLYYGDELGRPGGVMTYFPFPDIARGRPGVGEVGETVFSVPEGALPFWIERLERAGIDGLNSDEAFGARRTATPSPCSPKRSPSTAPNELPSAVPPSARGPHVSLARKRRRGARSTMCRITFPSSSDPSWVAIWSWNN